MNSNDKPYDVFISHAIADSAIARRLARSLQVAGFSAFQFDEMTPGADRDHASHAAWEALAESIAFVAIVSSDPLTENVIVEIGAASAWDKPIYLLLESSVTTLPSWMTKFPAFPIGRLDEIVHAVRSAAQPLSDEERQLLQKLYAETNVRTDELDRQPRALQSLTRRFNNRTGRALSGERLLNALFRLRKSGALPRLRRKPSERRTSTRR